MTMVWSPDYAPVDGDFDSVSLLLKGEGTNGSTTILDSSSNNFSVTANGDAQIINTVATPFSPTVPSDGVLAFDGTGDYLTVPSSVDFEFGTSDFTIEGWWFRTSDALGGLVDIGFNYGGVGIYQVPSNLIVRLASTDILTVTTFSSNQWVHFALSRSGSSVRLFFNGTQQGNTVSNSTSLVNTSGIVAVGAFNSNGIYYPTPAAYLSNLRITKGVARYTENFDVPTAPFPIYSPTTRAQA